MSDVGSVFYAASLIAALTGARSGILRARWPTSPALRTWARRVAAMSIGGFGVAVGQQRNSIRAVV